MRGRWRFRIQDNVVDCRCVRVKLRREKKCVKQNVRHWPAQCCWVSRVSCMAFCGQIYFLKSLHYDYSMTGVILVVLGSWNYFCWCYRSLLEHGLAPRFLGVDRGLCTGKCITVAAVSLVTLADQFFFSLFQLSCGQKFSFYPFQNVIRSQRKWRCM